MCSYFTLFRTLRQTYRQTPRSTHRRTQPFTPFGAVWRFAAALWRRLTAPAGLPPPLPTLPEVTTVLRVASPLLRLVVEPAGASVLRHLPGELRSPCYLLLICGRPQFAQLCTGLFASSERQWKEMLVVVAGMSGQSVSERRMRILNQERCKLVR